jgi:hypothetical protein
MKNKLSILIILMALGFGASSQVYQTNPAYGWKFNRIKIDSTFTLPIITDTTITPTGSGNKQGSLATYITGSDTLLAYWYSGRWRVIATTGSLSNYLAKSDSSIYQTTYRGDTARVNTYTALAGKEPTITTGTTLQYIRGDKSLATLNTSAVPEGSNLYNRSSNLSVGTVNATTVTVNNSDGTGVQIPAATITTAGLLGSVDKTTLTNLATTYVQNQTTTNQAGGFRVAGSGTVVDFFGIGNIGSTSISLYNRRNITGSTTSYGNYTQAQIQKDVTSAFMYRSNPSFADSVVTDVSHFNATQGALTGAAVVNNQSGFRAENTLTGATNNYGFYGNLASATGRWNLYMNGTASNYIAGALTIGSTTVPVSAALAITSTTQAVLFPRMTTTQKNAITTPLAGMVVYDTTLGKLCVYTTVWETITSL